MGLVFVQSLVDLCSNLLSEVGCFALVSAFLLGVVVFIYYR